MSPFELIRTEAADYSIQRLCRLLDVSRSGYYDYLARREQPPAPRHDRLIVLIRAVHASCEGAYGVRRMHRELLEVGENVSRKLVRRLMREHGIRSVHTPRFHKTTDSNHSLGFAPNLLGQDFTTVAADRVWVGDITYVWTAEGWCYLAVLLDLYSRRVVGWAMDSSLHTDLPCVPSSALWKLAVPHPASSTIAIAAVSTLRMNTAGCSQSGRCRKA